MKSLLFDSGDIKMKKNKKLSKPVLLRKEKLRNAAIITLAEMVNLPPSTNPINVTSLARELGVTRQAIYNNNLKVQVNEHADLQRKNFNAVSEKAIIRRPLEDRIEILQKENEEMQKKLDVFVERWATIEHNARQYGWDTDLLFSPMPLPMRKTLVFRKK